MLPSAVAAASPNCAALIGLTYEDFIEDILKAAIRRYQAMLGKQALLVTGSARMETWRQSGDSLAGRYLPYRLHPISVREWCEQQGGEESEGGVHECAIC